MSDNRSGMLTPALIGGAVAGLLSSIPFLNCLCCVWIIGGAMVAAWLLARNSPVSLSPSDGALVGALTGVIAAIVNGVVSIPLQAANADVMRRFIERMSEFTEEMPEGWDRFLEGRVSGGSPAMFFVGLLVSAALFTVLGTLGGLLGASFFGRKAAPPTVPPTAPPAEIPR